MIRLFLPHVPNTSHPNRWPLRSHRHFFPSKSRTIGSRRFLLHRPFGSLGRTPFEKRPPDAHHLCRLLCGNDQHGTGKLSAGGLGRSSRWPDLPNLFRCLCGFWWPLGYHCLLEHFGVLGCFYRNFPVILTIGVELLGSPRYLGKQLQYTRALHTTSPQRQTRQKRKRGSQRRQASKVISQKS